MIGVRFLLIFSLFFCSFRLYTEENQKQKIVWRFDFTANGAAAKFAKEWSLEKKFMTKPATFFVKKEKGKSFLEMEADCATASIVCNPKGFKVVDAPIIRWCWKVTCLPNGADGRFPEKDDQAIGIYVGSGSYFSKKSISYRWDTETPVGDKGNCAYGAGTIKVKWFTLRNKNDK
ncbi:MAG TPA: DUF3047 domain-containing protein, partial [Victivallales bacterium]|nr:DUF3047 domain-containing protein [Victivallales bacterium]